jgi:hypothetical protein
MNVKKAIPYVLLGAGLAMLAESIKTGKMQSAVNDVVSNVKRMNNNKKLEDMM